MKKKEYFILIFICVCTLSCVAQPVSKCYSDAYNLHFSINTNSSIGYSWMENAAYLGCAVPYLIEESGRRLLAKKYFKGFQSDRLRTEIEQRIVLPNNNEKEGQVIFESKGENLENIFIILDGINSEEKYIFSDTVKVTSGHLLNKVSKKIPLIGVNLLNIRIRAEGKINKEAYIAYSKLDIMIGNKNINEYPLILPKLPTNKNINFIPLNTDYEFGEIDIMKNGKIIAIGESVHGNSSVRNLAYRLIMESVKTRGYKLVLWEMPMEMSLVYNRYVTDSKFMLDSIETAFIDIQSLNFINELRLHNFSKTAKEKVCLLGIDYNSTWKADQNSAMDIFDFIMHLNKKQKIYEVNMLLSLLMEKDWNKAIDYLKSHKTKIRNLLTEDEIECILHILTLSLKMGTERVNRFVGRDSVMFVNTKFLLEYFSVPVAMKSIVYAHNVHVNPVSTFPAVHCDPFGMYMKKQYSNDYIPLLILIGKGSATVYDWQYNEKEKDLQHPPVGSIELFLNQQESNVCYFPMSTFFNKIVLSRYKGDKHTIQEFYPYNLYQRYKGMLFIKEEYENENIKKEIKSVDEIRATLSIRNKRRLKFLESINDHQ